MTTSKPTLPAIGRTMEAARQMLQGAILAPLPAGDTPLPQAVGDALYDALEALQCGLDVLTDLAAMSGQHEGLEAAPEVTEVRPSVAATAFVVLKEYRRIVRDGGHFAHRDRPVWYATRGERETALRYARAVAR